MGIGHVQNAWRSERGRFLYGLGACRDLYRWQVLAVDLGLCSVVNANEAVAEQQMDQ